MNRSRVAKFAFVLTIVALIVGVSACDQVQQLLLPTPPDREDVSVEIPIGLVYPATGRLADFALPIRRGFELALEEINNSQLGDLSLKFIDVDDQSTIEGAVEAYNELIQAGVPVIFGPTTSGQAEAAFPIAAQNEVVAFSSSSNATGLSALGDFIFRAGLTTDILLPGGVRATHAKLGYQRVAIIYDETDSYSIDSYEKFRDALTEIGVEILTTETFQSTGIPQNDNIDFSDQLTRIKAANPETIFIAAQLPEQTGILIQGRQLGIPTTVPFITSLINDVENAGAAAEGTISFAGWINTADTPGNQAFVQKYRAAYASEPNAWTAQSYAAVYIVVAAIAEAQSTDPTAIRDALVNTKNFDTVLGAFSFNAVGDAVYDPIVQIVENGEFQIFE
ncbi:ABC transporter substrate-binding protein [Candidatus Poribacteria bacterium]|nr:ABC transporter substrate-binding protein [Candidatus Poribacteria bacterium]